MLTLKNTMPALHYSRGFSLIELMLAMLIGLLITAGIFSLHISTRDTQRSSEDQLNLLADARFAIDTITYDLRHAGSWGANNLWKTLFCHKDDAARCTLGPVVTAVGDCETRWYLDFKQSIIGSNGINPYGATCANNGFVAGTDVLGVKYADSTPIDSLPLPGLLAPGVAYIRSNTQTGQVFVGNAWSDYGQYKFANTVSNNIVTKNHLLVARLYYVSNYTDAVGDGRPSLRRVFLSTGPQFEEEVLIPGVEDFQVLYGIDTTPTVDGTVDTYVAADNVQPTIIANAGAKVTAADVWDRVIAVKIWVLVRSQRQDRAALASTQTLSYAGKTVPAFADGYKRYLVSSVVRLRN